MKQERYIPEPVLPKTASNEEIDAILAALQNRRYKIVGAAHRSVVELWGMTTESFVAAIETHLEVGYRIFHKRVNKPPPDTLLFSANIGLDPESDNEDEDVYVEIRLRNNTAVILCDAHSHYNWQPRLPK